MNREQRALLERILAFEIDRGPVALPFTARLANENGWTPAYADRVVAEYKRFVFLAAAAGHPVTPSDAVDQAWHLHLAYTRSYWGRLCGEVLGRPLHHGPTEGGPAERAKFGDWYARTLESYERLFGERPPGDIWPGVAERFGGARFVRVDAARHWVVPRPRGRAVVAGLGLVTGTSALAGCGYLAANGAVGWGWVVPAVVLLAVVWVLAVVKMRERRRRERLRGRGADAGGCGGCGAAGGAWYWPWGGGGGGDCSDGGGGCGGGCGS